MLAIEDIYWTSIEYTYAGESPPLVGGFVYGFVKAFDEKEALAKFVVELTRQALEVKHVEFISPYDVYTKWETKALTMAFCALYLEAKNSNEVIFDTFYAYQSEE